MGQAQVDLLWEAWGISPQHFPLPAPYALTPLMACVPSATHSGVSSARAGAWTQVAEPRLQPGGQLGATFLASVLSTAHSPPE